MKELKPMFGVCLILALMYMLIVLMYIDEQSKNKSVEDFPNHSELKTEYLK